MRTDGNIFGARALMSSGLRRSSFSGRPLLEFTRPSACANMYSTSACSKSRPCFMSGLHSPGSESYCTQPCTSIQLAGLMCCFRARCLPPRSTYFLSTNILTGSRIMATCTKAKLRPL